MIKRFNRYEIKYQVRAAALRTLIPDLLAFLQRDAHGAASGFYSVSSLYFDTPDLDCFRNKLDGLLYRRKLRIRTYPDAPAAPAFVEVKQRVNRTVQKRRVPMALDDAYALCSGHRYQLDDEQDQAVADEVHYLVEALRLSPQVVVTYCRQAFVGHFVDPGLRVTFDTMVRSRRAGFDLEQADRPRSLVWPADVAIMELKMNERIPHWLSNLLARHECFLTRVSKYCQGIARLIEQERYARTVT